MKKYTRIFCMILALVVLTGCSINIYDSNGNTVVGTNNGGFQKGVVENGIWKSEYFGLSFDVVGDYNMLSDAEIQETLNAGTAVTGEAGSQLVVFEMYAKAPRGIPAVVVYSDRILDYSIDSHQYAKLVEQESSYYASANYSAVSRGIEEVQLCGMSFDVLTLDISSNENEFVQRTYFREFETRMLIIQMTALKSQEQDLDEMAEHFSVYE